ncbi:MAG: glycosyltransferase family 4 protein [Ferruginibacter sp.]
MHICFITHEYPKVGFPHGGVGTFIKSLAGSLVRSGHNISVVGMNYTKQDEVNIEDGVLVYRIGKRTFKGLTWVLNSKRINDKLQQIHRANKIDIVECTELGLAFIKKQKGIKYIIRLNGGHHFFSASEQRGIDSWKGFQEKKSFRKADKVLGVSEYVINHTAKYIDFADKRGPIIYNPANFSKFYEANPGKKVTGRIFFAGTVSEKKGIRQLIQAMPIIKKQFAEAHLIIAGRDSKMADGSSYIEYVSKFIDPCVSDLITFLGAVANDKIPELIEQAEVCVYPSHMEAMPLAWIEVMSMGKAFIGSNLGPGPEVISHGVTGLMCNPLDPNDIATKTIEILKDKSFGEMLGRNARADMLKRFATDSIIRQNLDFYESVIEG